jgi:geranylgeranyl reductase
MAGKASKASAEILTSAEVIKIEKNHLETRGGAKYQFDYLIGADGSRSIVRKYLGLKNEKEMIAIHYKTPAIFPEMEFYFDAKMFGSGYAWIFPHKDFTSIGCGVDPNFLITAEALQKNFQKWLKDIWLKNRLFDLATAKYEAWMINYDYKGHQFDNIFLIGDAAGLASGLTGEGMYFAMVSGIEAAKKILDPDYKMPAIDTILKVKKHHEEVLSLMEINKTLSQIEYNSLIVLLKTRLLDKKLIHSFS